MLSAPGVVQCPTAANARADRFTQRILRTASNWQKEKLRRIDADRQMCACANHPPQVIAAAADIRIVKPVKSDGMRRYAIPLQSGAIRYQYLRHKDGPLRHGIRLRSNVSIRFS